jgi:hypothetical protein
MAVATISPAANVGAAGIGVGEGVGDAVGEGVGRMVSIAASVGSGVGVGVRSGGKVQPATAIRSAHARAAARVNLPTSRRVAAQASSRGTCDASRSAISRALVVP